MSGLPSGWSEKRLGEICEFRYGKSLPHEARRSGETPVYGSNGVVGFHNVALTTGPTIVVGRKGSSGEVNFSTGPCWPIDTTYYVDGSCTNADLPWLSYRLSALGLNQMNRAAAVPGLNREDAYRTTLLLPPLPEQRRIAAILDKAEELRAKRRAALTQLDGLTQAVFSEVLPVGGEAHAPLVSVEDALEAIIDYRGKSPEKTAAGVPLVTARVVKGGDLLEPTEFIAESDYASWMRRGLPKAGDVVFTTEAPLGEVAQLDGRRIALAQRLLVLRGKPSLLDNTYLRFALTAPQVRQQIESRATGSTVKGIRQSELRKVLIPLPPLIRQQDFAHKIASLHRVRRTCRASSLELDVLFASLQHRAFAGEL